MTLRSLIILLLTITLATTAILYCEMIGYGYAQLKGQLHIVWEARPVEEVIADPATPDSIRKKLQLIQEIKQFATDSLGLTPSNNYSTFYDQRGKPALWVLTACEPFRMQAFEWKFPFLGAVSYKGFFIKEKGKPEEAFLKNQGYDTEYAPTGGWSTLGWFKDPVLSNMLRRSDGRLAELIIHELTHGTYYKAGAVDYNENLATFMGEQGAMRFLRAKYGNDTTALHTYRNYLEDEMLFGAYMLHAVASLDSLYAGFTATQTPGEKARLKMLRIYRICKGIDTLPLHTPERYRFNMAVDPLPNNAWFMGYSRYRKLQTGFEKELKSAGNDLRRWLRMKKG